MADLGCTTSFYLFWVEIDVVEVVVVMVVVVVVVVLVVMLFFRVVDNWNKWTHTRASGHFGESHKESTSAVYLPFAKYSHLDALQSIDLIELT